MSTIPDYAQNHELFADFYGLQNHFAGCLAARPGLVRAWLEALPPRDPEAAESSSAARSWRTARLSAARRRELHSLIARAERPPSETEPLAGWLLTAVPVRTYLEMAAAGSSHPRALDDAAGDCHRRLIEVRDTLFLANYGLAKAAAKRRFHQDYPDMLSAASCGLLDAIDRYVPDGKAARFAYFAGYWIRYHMARQFQKNASVVSFPVNQHRIGRRIHHYVTNRRADHGLDPSEAEVCAELRLGRKAYGGQMQRPTMISLQCPAGSDPGSPAMEHCLCDPSPEPAAVLEETEIGQRLRDLLQAQADPVARVMLAYVHQVGVLADAAQDYLAWLQETAHDRLTGAG